MEYACNDMFYQCAGRPELSMAFNSQKKRKANMIKDCAIYKKRIKTEKTKEVVKAEDCVIRCCFSF